MTMMMKTSILLMLLRIIMILGNGIVEIKFQQYSNPDGYSYDGRHCDASRRLCTCVFHICLSSVTTGGNYSCIKTKSFKEDMTKKINFHSVLATGVNNPWIVRLPKLEKKYEFSFTIIDINKNRLYDRIVEDIPLHVTDRNRKLPERHNLDHSMGTRYPKYLDITVSSFCSDEYKPPDCVEKSCVARDDLQGHYKCLNDGTKICLSGWKNISINCLERVCNPRNDSIGHHTCLQNGTKICLPGWKNISINCLERVCNPRNNSKGHFTCLQNGTKICLPGWKNMSINCLERVCNPRNNSKGHYTCLQNGTKICLPGWKNVSINCLERVCKPRNDSEGHYTCLQNGTKICLPGWKNISSNCLERVCNPRNDSEGHYTCLQNGTKMCLPGWNDPKRNCLIQEFLPTVKIHTFKTRIKLAFTSSIDMQASVSIPVVINQETSTGGRNEYRQMNMILVIVTGICIIAMIVFSLILCCQRKSVMKKLRRQQEMIEELSNINSQASPRDRSYTDISLDNLAAAESTNQTNQELMETSYGIHEGFHNPLMCRNPFVISSDMESENQLYEASQKVSPAHRSKRPSIEPQTSPNVYACVRNTTARPSIFEFPPLPPKKMLKVKKKHKNSSHKAKFELPPAPTFEANTITENVIYSKEIPNKRENELKTRTKEPIITLLDEFKEKYQSQNKTIEKRPGNEVYNIQNLSEKRPSDEGYDSWGNEEQMKKQYINYSQNIVSPNYD